MTCPCQLPAGAWSAGSNHFIPIPERSGNRVRIETCPAVMATPAARLTRANVDPRYLGYAREGYIDWPAEADAFLADPQGFLCITGPNGSGKTRLAVAILDELLQRGWQGRYANAKDLADEARILDQYGRLTDEAIAEQRACDAAQILLLDDLFSEAAFKATHIRQRVEHRYRKAKPILITSMVTAHGYPDLATKKPTKRRMSDIDSDLASRVLSGRVIERKGLDRRVFKQEGM